MQYMKAFSGKMFQKIKRLVGSAIGDFDLIKDGDHIAVAVSGGKDSYVLLHMLETLRQRAPVKFRLTAVNIDIGFPGYRFDIIEKHLREHDFAYRMVPTKCFKIIEQKRTPDSSFCAFCARLRRGVLYTQAQVDGYWVVLEVGKEHFDYRVGANGYFSLCIGGGDFSISPPDNSPPKQ